MIVPTRFTFINQCPNCGRVYPEYVRTCGICGLPATKVGKLEENTAALYAEKDNICEGSILRSYTGREYRLSKQLGEGGEGIVYNVLAKDLVAKIYRKKVFASESKLRYMVEHPLPNAVLLEGEGLVRLAWPVDVLYDRHGEFVGYVMPKIEYGIEIFEIARGAQSKKTTNMFKDYSWMLNLIVARNLAAAIDYVHSNGVVIGDMNCKNIMVNPDHSITLLDCDSFDIMDKSTGVHYKCRTATEDYLAPELQGKNLHNEIAAFSRSTDAFALAIHIFQLLMDNRYPFNGVIVGQTSNANSRLDNIANGLCPYLNKELELKIPPGAPYLEQVVPPLLQEDFRQTFGYNAATLIDTISQRTTPSTWAEHLNMFINGSLANFTLKECGHHKEHICIKELGLCGFCEAERRYQEFVEKSRKARKPSKVAKFFKRHKSTIAIWGFLALIIIPGLIFAPRGNNKLSFLKSSDIYHKYLYWTAQRALESKDYERAIDIYGDLKDLKGVSEASYRQAKDLIAGSKYKEALAVLRSLSGANYKDSKLLFKQSSYAVGKKLLAKQQYEDAYIHLRDLSGYKDSEALLYQAMEGYVITGSSRNLKYEFLRTFKEKNYRTRSFDLDGKYKELFSWKIKILAVTTDSKFTKENSVRSFKENVWTRIYFRLIGGPPYKETNIVLKSVDDMHAHDDIIYKKIREGGLCSLNFSYHHDTELFFYDDEGNQIGYEVLKRE